MARLTPTEIAETIRIRNGCKTNAEAAGILGLSESAFNTRWRRLRGQPLGTEPPAPSIHKPRISIRAATQYDEGGDGPIYTVVAIGDHHDKPGRDKLRARWIGRLIVEHEPDFVVSIGDWASIDSLSSHEQAGSASDAERPGFNDELDSLNDSLGHFHRDFPVGSIPVFMTYGNHEHRAFRVANNFPKQSGDLPYRLEQVFAQFRWLTRPFGEFLNIGGVDFVHCPLNVMGREYGGEQVERSVGNKALRSLVMGHTHRSSVYTAPKVGQQRSIKVVNLGTSMPWGVVEKYNGVAMTGWDYGVNVLRIQNGQILSVKFIDMLELFERFGD